MGGEPLGLQYVHHVECQKCRWTRKTVLISVLILTANGSRQNLDKRGHIVVPEPDFSMAASSEVTETVM